VRVKTERSAVDLASRATYPLHHRATLQKKFGQVRRLELIGDAVLLLLRGMGVGRFDAAV